MNGVSIGILMIWLFLPCLGWCQEKPERWDLRSCIDYAKEQNIQVRKSRIVLEENQENTHQVKANLFPSLAFSTSQDLVNRPKSLVQDKNSYSGNYGLNTSLTLYNGGRLKKEIQLSELQERIQKLTIQEAENNIELAITQAYIQVLYATEAIKINRNTMEVSEATVARARELLNAGSISRTDLAQLEAQYSTDKYQLVVAQTNLDNMLLQLKQLLELEITDEMNLVIPMIPEERVLTVLPGKLAVYETSLKVMPEIKYSALNIEAAGLEKAKAKTGYFPVLSLSAGIATGHVSGSDYAFSSQLKNSFNESIGLSLKVPIYSNRSNKTAVKLAQLNIENTELDYQSVKKDLLKSVESVYLDATSSQDQFRAARENLQAVELSFKLTQEQFNLGMKNTVELLTEQNNYQTAQQELLQAKYMAILNQQLLNFYQGKKIEL